MIPTRTTRAEACRAATRPETSVVVIGRMTIQGRCIVMQPRPRRLDWYSVRDDLLHLRRTSSRRRAVLPALRSSMAAACTNCGTPLVPGARFCATCGTPAPGTVVGAASPTTQTVPRAPVTVSERRLVTVMFADLVGFTTLAE